MYLLWFLIYVVICIFVENLCGKKIEKLYLFYDFGMYY